MTALSALSAPNLSGLAELALPEIRVPVTPTTYM
ncbi:hypothetical protein BH24CHL1_BH24CHL1_04440 [soil metagenome]